MRSISSQSMIFSCILSLLVLSPFSTSAFASPSSRKATGSCSHLHVHLNGKQPATQTCLDGQASTNGVSEGSDCETPDIELILWWDAKFKGDNICFSGTGSTDLGVYPKPALAICLCTSWDKQASSYQMKDVSMVKTIWDGTGGTGLSFSGKDLEGDFSDTVVHDNNASSITIESA